METAVMNYRLTALTPLLVGDGQRLSPIDYMVWKDQVNVLDQRRIFRLLAKGPRLEGYLAQLRRAEKLDFASWGGFAQNFAGRRIPFEHASSSAVWEQARAEHLHIPTFCSGPGGAYLPASAIKGALRTGVVFSRWNNGVLREIASRMEGDRPLRNPGEAAELMTLGPSGSDPLKVISAADSRSTPYSAFKIYLVKVSSLNARAAGKYEVTWKTSASPLFAEMAAPGTQFTGELHELAYLKDPEIAKALHWKETSGLSTIFRASNAHAAGLLEIHKHYAESSGLTHVHDSIVKLQAELDTINSTTTSCLINLGWGGGFLGKAAFLDTESDDYRKVLRLLPFYSRAVKTGLPFPKTRRIVFTGNQPAALPGWARLDITA
jgi:CRISPR-associated protein Csm5